MDQSMGLFDPQDANQEKYIDGQLKAVFFSSNDSFYKVLLVEISEKNFDWPEPEIVVTGNFGDVVEDGSYRFQGKVVSHPRYGQQFQAENYSNLMMTTEDGVVRYLSGERFPGVGKRTAERVVKALGTDAIQKINRDGSVLDRVPISKKQREAILDNIGTDDQLEQIIIALNSYGFSSKVAAAIYEKYHEDTLQVIHDNPYQLVEDISGISFKRADMVALKSGIAPDAIERIRAALLYAIQKLCFDEGDTYTTAADVLDVVGPLLDNNMSGRVPGEKLAEGLIQLGEEEKVVSEDGHLYLGFLYNAEEQIAEHLDRIIKNKDEKALSYSDETIAKQMRLVEKQLDITYDKSQENAIKMAVQSPVFILTGGPGTGKTTIINGIVHAYAQLHSYSLDLNDYGEKPFPIVMAAPTGRAAKHMTDSTGLPASTIHRLLGLNGSEANDFSGPKDIEGSLLIIDEMSMVDTSLFRLLIRAVPNHMQVVLVGDQDQLPSVGPGQVFHDLLASKQITALQLNNIYRQEKGSSIVRLAHEIHRGELPEDFEAPQPDRTFIACSDSQMPSVIEQVARRAKTKNFDLMNVQVLAPMYRGNAGIDHLNDVLQQVWQVNPSGKRVTIREHVYRIGDKVLQLINNPEQNVFNGDLGVIVGMTTAGKQEAPQKITIAFDETEVTYDKNAWNQFTLAYCTSIHKAQGSEFPMVILPMVHQYSRMLQRNLLYTAVTRASEFLIMLGEKRAFEQCVRSLSANRKTGLVRRLTETINNQPDEVEPESDESSEKVAPKTEMPDHLTEAVIEAESVDPLIGMAGVTPYDFNQ